MLSLGSELKPHHSSVQGKGWIVSMLMHMVLIALFFLPMIMTRTPPPEHEGLLVNLGLQDQGQREEIPKGNSQEVEPEPVQTKQTEPVKQQTATSPSRQVAQKSITSNEQSEVTSREEEAKKQAQAEAQRKAAEEAQRQEAYNNTKKTYGDLLGTGGKGNTGKPGSQGDPNGDPNSNILEGISKGSGRVGGGLGNRGVLHEPQIQDRSQKTGRVVISVCVDKVGKVIKAEYTQKGSTTTDTELKEIARKAALQFKFTDSEIEEQCGTITVDFKVRG